jgi:Domain of unknown function (DUF4375)
MTKARPDYFQDFTEAKHFRGKVKWDTIKDLTGSDFLWEILEPISLMIKDTKHEEARAKRLSPNQKALHFFWYLDGQVTNGGFIQFYWNGYELYLPSIKKGLELMGCNDLLEKLVASELEYDKHITEFEKWRAKGDWEWLYDNLKEFDKLDDWYYSKNEDMYATIEHFVKQHIDDFIIKS